jgi:hypothetical protein
MAKKSEKKGKKPLSWEISRERPLIILQTSPRFGDADDEASAGSSRAKEATRHGKEAVRAWRQGVPDDIKPYCQLQMEVRTRDHKDRYDALRRVFDELEKENIPANFQFADPHNIFTFDPEYVEKLVQEYSCIKSLTITEQRYEHYETFNVQRYAMSAETRYAIDIVDMAARYGKHLILALQDMKWMHVGADYLNQPLVDAIIENGEYVVPVNEHIGPRHIARQTSVYAWWLAGMTDNWGIEPQSWWFENGRMIQPGLFGQTEPDNTRIMPPDLYRAMLLLGAQLGSTVYVFEPFWDLFDYDNSHCWREYIYPTLMEIIERKLIPARKQVMEKTKVAYQYNEAKTIMEFHESLRDVDWIGDQGLLAKAAYGLWEKYLMHELIPNKSKHFYIPLFPPKTPQKVLDKFEHVIKTGECDSVAAYEKLLGQYYTDADQGTAFIVSINDHTYIMQTHENLYERQTYKVELPKPVRGITAERRAEGVALTWEKDAGATQYHVHRVEAGAFDKPFGFSDTIWVVVGKHFNDPELRNTAPPQQRPEGDGYKNWNPYPEIGCTKKPFFVDTGAKAGKTYTYTVTATTKSTERREGTVNYLDFLVFSERQSLPVEQVTLDAQGRTTVKPYADPEDKRPEKSPDYYPTFDGAEGANRIVAQQIVDRFEQFKQAFEQMDRHKIMEYYSANYQDPNGWHREYVARAWKWWFFRLNSTTLLRQIRRWDFSRYAETGQVDVLMFSLYRGCRWEDGAFGYSYDGTMRLPRARDEEIVYTWVQEADQAWRMIRTNPAMPCFEEMLSYSRGVDKKDYKCTPGLDEI